MKLASRGNPSTSKALFTIVGGAVLINPAFTDKAMAQAPQDQQGEVLEEVVVT